MGFIVGLAAAYALTGILGMQLAAPPGNVTPVWLPAGISVVGLLLFGRRVWPGITLGSFICNVLVFPEGPSQLVRLVGALAIAVGSTVGLLTIATLVKRSQKQLEVLSSPGALVAFGGFTALGCAINATGGLLTTAVLSHVPAGAWGSYWLTWWLGDSVGVLLVTPLVLREGTAPPRRPIEWAVTLAYTLAATQLVFGRPFDAFGGGPYPLAFMMTVGAVWAGVRLGARAVCAHALLMYPLLSWATIAGRGPFGPYPHEIGLLLIDALLVVVTITGLLLTTLSALARRQQHALEQERALLEARVTERTSQLEASTRQLVEAQKQEALGRLAGGVAHDFNNLLMVITGEAELLRRKAGQSHEVQDGSGAILAAAYRAGELTRQLLVVARRQPTTPRHVDFTETLATNRRLLRPLLPESVRLDVSCEEGCAVEMDPTLLDQIILNLALNARDAVGEAGTVRIEASTRTLDEAEARALGLTAGRWVRLSVSDDGHGIPAEVQGRIFEPFFTTKSDGRGTGLGLSTVLGIAQQAKGTVKVTSVPGRTVFDVWLPSSDRPVERKPLPSEPARSTVAPATVLVVEDEPMVRRTLVLTLERAGHRALTANDGEEALQILRKPDHGVALVLTDVVMPRLGGVELAREVRALSRLPVLFMSAFHERQVELAKETVLVKPFTADQLIAAVDAMLRARAA